MEGTCVIWIFFIVHGDVLVKAGQPLVALFTIRSDSERVIVGNVWLVIYESGLVSSRQVSRLTIVVPRAIEELPVSVRQRFRKLLTPEVHIRIEINMPQTHSECEPES